MSPEEEFYIRHKWNGRLGITGDQWVELLQRNEALDLPWSAPGGERQAASRAKTDDLMQTLPEDPSWLKKVAMSGLATLYQGFQGAKNLQDPDVGLLDYSPNWADFKGNLSSIWNYKRKKRGD